MFYNFVLCYVLLNIITNCMNLNYKKALSTQADFYDACWSFNSVPQTVLSALTIHQSYALFHIIQALGLSITTVHQGTPCHSLAPSVDSCLSRSLQLRSTAVRRLTYVVPETVVVLSIF